MEAQSYLERRHTLANGVVPFRPERMKLLLSYHYFKKSNLTELMAKYFGDKTPTIFIDSGAFSAATQGVEIDINEYCDFLKQYESMLTIYANLDVIGDPQKTYDNQKVMELAGLRPTPVFHTGESLDWLKRYIDEGYDYIALGGMVPYSKDKKALVSWMSACFNEAEKHKVKINYHGFGMTNWDLMRAYPWKSVDSSSWCSGFRYGQVYLFDDKIGRFYQVGLRDIKGSFKFKRILEGIGFSPNDIALDAEFDRVKVATISALAFMKAEEFLNRQNRGSLRLSSAAIPSVHGDGQQQSPREDGARQPQQVAAGDRGSVRQTANGLILSADKCNGESSSRPRSACDGGRSGSNNETDVYIVSLPPKVSEETSESKFVGGHQMFDAFSKIVGGLNE